MQIGEMRTKNGYFLGEVSSALQKAIRRGREYDACFWAAEMCNSGFDNFMWRRLATVAVEDVGVGYPLGIVVVASCREVWMAYRKTDKGKTTTMYLNVVFCAVLTLCRAPKNREADDILNIIERDFKDGKLLAVGEESVDCHTPRGRVNIAREVRETGQPRNEVINRQFWGNGARLDRPQSTDPALKSTDEKNWSAELVNTDYCPGLSQAHRDAYFTPCKGSKPYEAPPKKEDGSGRVLADGQRAFEFEDQSGWNKSTGTSGQDPEL